MQNRYAADIGDYIKLALLRHLSAGRKLGIAWYLYPDEGHNGDGKHTRYLSDSERWRALDPSLFDALGTVASGTRSVAALQASGAIQATAICNRPIVSDALSKDRSAARASWFAHNLTELEQCDLVLADPDNGIIDDSDHRRGQPGFGKQMPLSEVLALAAGRSAVIYHHNTRFKGGHHKEVDHWLAQLGLNAIAVRANAYSCRTFFIVNPDGALAVRAAEFCDRWKNHKVWLHNSV
ncbi:hypothetical protein [Devosia sp.]|uniref:hypothetical protein n=1 Tax=Devosia sp. TaxID=1871048 RepID=UPI0019F0CC7E|nr:hypothetical protein [Devosia sp.]MBE0580150.1 hypothetical protein [Devosia sp.]